MMPDLKFRLSDEQTRMLTSNLHRKDWIWIAEGSQAMSEYGCVGVMIMCYVCWWQYHAGLVVAVSCCRGVCGAGNMMVVVV